MNTTTTARRRLYAALAATLTAVALTVATPSVNPAAAYMPPPPQMIATPVNELQAWVAYVDSFDNPQPQQSSQTPPPHAHDLGPNTRCWDVVGDDWYPVSCNPPADLGPED